MTDLAAFDCIVFDCDGVLIDSEHIYNAANYDALRSIGYETTLERLLHRFTGVPYEAMFAAIEADLGRPLPDGFVDDLNRRIAERFEVELEAIPGVAHVLDHLDRPKCVASSTLMPELRRNLERVGLLHRFDPHVFSTSQVVHGKPAPDLFLLAAETMGHPPARCLVIEDSVAGTRAGVAAGMTVIGFTGASHGFDGHADHLTAEGAIAVADDMTQLASMLDIPVPV